MILNELKDQQLINPPDYVMSNTAYLTLTGSIAYGVSDDLSDTDIYGFCVPYKELIFPHLSGQIEGFGRQKQRFDQWQNHHIKYNKREYDFSIYSIVRFFHLCMENNPNMIDALFTPRNCIIHTNRIGEMVRENRKLFLHKGSWHKCKGYAFSQLNKLNRKAVGKRKENIEKFGYDIKYGYHVVRLLDEAEQILEFGDLDLQRAKEMLKSIRRGDWTLEDIRDHFSRKEKQLEELYHTSSLQHRPDEQAIKNLLLNCLEECFGNIDAVIARADTDYVPKSVIYEIKNLCDNAL